MAESEDVQNVNELVSEYMDYTGPREWKESMYDVVKKEYNDKWDDNQRNAFNAYFDNYVETSINSKKGQDDIANYEKERLTELTKVAIAAKKYAELQGSSYIKSYPDIMSRIHEEAKSANKAQVEEQAALWAMNDVLYSQEENWKDPTAVTYNDILTQKNTKACMEQKKQIEETMESLANRDKENLVRGALLKCNCGSHYRRLNLRKDHGVLVRERPRIHEKDAVPDTYSGGDPNICWFGICSSVLDHKEPLKKEKIRLQPYTQTDAYGRYLAVPQDASIVGIRCRPKFERNEWQQCDSYASISEDGPFSQGGVYDFYNVATLQSYIMCIHGGVISPIDSGQEGHAMFPPPYAQCPFLVDRTAGSPFMKWCDANGICPHMPGVPDYDAWYAERIKNAKAENVPGEEYTKNQEYADVLYENWLTGMVMYCVTDDEHTFAKLRESNKVVSAYYHGDTPPGPNTIGRHISEIVEKLNTSPDV